MLKSLEGYEPKIYAGLLARSALYLKNNIAGRNNKIINNEEEVIRNVIDEIVEKYKYDLNKSEDIEKITNYIDDEIDSIVPEIDVDNVMLKLAEKAELPSDLYEVNVINNVKEFYGIKFKNEFELIKETIKRPDKEQHYGPSIDKVTPSLVSLFSKYYKNKYPNNSFTLLVVAQREKLKLNVHQVWRIYSDVVPNENISNLIDLLKAFADVFGFEIEIDGKRGKFFLSETTSIKNEFNFRVIPPVNTSNKPIKRTFTFTNFIQQNVSKKAKQVSLIVAIDLTKYLKLLKSRY